MPKLSHLIALEGIECLLCRYPMIDGGVQLSKLNVQRFANWWLAQRGTSFDLELLSFDPWICMFCIWKARMQHKRVRGIDVCDLKKKFVWWPLRKDPNYKYYKAGWLRPSLVHLKYCENINNLKCDCQIKKPRLENEVEAVFLPVLKTERIDLLDDDLNSSEDFAHNPEAEVDPFLGYNQDLLSENSTCQDLLMGHQLHVRKAVGMFLAEQRSLGFVPILPKTHHSTFVNQWDPTKFHQTGGSKTNGKASDPIDTNDPLSHISLSQEPDASFVTMPGYPAPPDTVEKFDVSPQSTFAQFLNFGASIVKENECFDQELLETETTDDLEIGTSKSEVVLKHFRSGLKTNPKEISSFKTLIPEKMDENSKYVAKIDDMTRLMLEFPDRDSLARFSSNWRRFISTDYGKCWLCLKNFELRDKQTALVHLAVAHKLYSCDQCSNKVFESAFELAGHMQDEHGISTKSLSCIICNFLFINEQQRDQHVEKIHSWQKYVNHPVYLKCKSIQQVHQIQLPLAKPVRKVPSILRRKRQI